MTLLERLGRPDQENVQVQIFTAMTSETAEMVDSAFVNIKKKVHQRLVE